MSGNTAAATTAGTGAPSGNCTPPVVYIDTTNQDLWFCGAANSWKRSTGSGGGNAPYVSSLLAGPDLTRTINGATHGFAPTALLVAVYDNASPRNAISVGWTVNPATYDVTIGFATRRTTTTWRSTRRGPGGYKRRQGRQAPRGRPGHRSDRQRWADRRNGTGRARRAHGAWLGKCSPKSTGRTTIRNGSTSGGTGTAPYNVSSLR
jgi:hypothetical protein